MTIVHFFSSLAASGDFTFTGPYVSYADVSFGARIPERSVSNDHMIPPRFEPNVKLRPVPHPSTFAGFDGSGKCKNKWCAFKF